MYTRIMLNEWIMLKDNIYKDNVYKDNVKG